MKIFFGKILGTLILLLLLFPLDAQTQPRPLRIGLVPEINIFNQLERFQPLEDYLTEKLGREVQFTILSHYGNVIDGFRTEKLDGAFLGSFIGALAIRKQGAIPLARPVNLDGESTYHGLIYTRRDSGIRTVTDMKGKKFAFVEKATTAGYLFPLSFLHEQKVTDIEEYFSDYFFGGSHDASLHAVLNHEADIGASKNTVFDWVRKADPRIDQEIVILAKSTKVPSNGLCVRKGIEEKLRNKLEQILLNLDRNPEGREVLKTLKALKFIDTSVADYRPVFEMARKAGIYLEKFDYSQ